MKEVAEQLKVSKTDTATRWCLDNGIKRIKLGNKNVVSEYDFRLAYEKPIVLELQKTYKDDWIDYYNAYDSEDTTAFYRLKILDNTENPINTRYNPDDFLKKIGYAKS